MNFLRCLINCNSFAKKKLYEGVKQNILSMKATLLERNSHLRGLKNRETLEPVAKEQAEINFYSQERMLKFIMYLGTFVCPSKCAIRDTKQRIPILTGISSQLDVQVQYYNMNRLAIDAKVQEFVDGCYEVSYTPTIVGDHAHSVSTCWMGPILGSPLW